MSEIDPEAVLLSALCKSPTARKQYLDKVEVEDFQARAHGKIFEAILNLERAGHHVSMDSLLSFFQDTVERMMVSFLFDTKTDSEITHELFAAFKAGGVRARQIKIRDFLSNELKKVTDPSMITEQLRVMVSNLEGQDAAIEVSEPEDVVDSTEWLIDQWAKGERPIVSGLPELDERLFLSQFIGYWVVAGNSGAGKSAFMCNLAKENGRRGIPGTICSLEMSKELLLIRMAMEDPRVRGLELTEKTVKNAEKMSDLKYAMGQFRKLPIYIVEGVYDIFRLDKISRKLALDKGCKYTLFDYIQLGKTKPTDSDVVRVYTVSRYLQGLTKPDLPNGYHGQVSIALSQYSNEATKSKNSVGTEKDEHGRKSNKPSNSDLAWSGQIKQDADGILHIYPVGDLTDPVLDVELYCGKQRNYKAGWTVHAKFIKAEQRFRTDLSDRLDAIRGVPTKREVLF